MNLGARLPTLAIPGSWGAKMLPSSNVQPIFPTTLDDFEIVDLQQSHEKLIFLGRFILKFDFKQFPW
jgi:hypothetical protein